MINRKIEYFITLAQCLSFSKTALKHDVSQTAISQFIASLEKSVGVRLFERSQRSVALTDAGKSYYNYALRCIREEQQELQILHAIAEGYHGTLKVGIGMYEYRSTEQFFSRFLTQHPEIRVDILQYPYSVLIEKLRTEQLDIIISDALCEEAFASRELKTRTLFESPNYLVAHPDVAAKHQSPAEMLRSECLITNCEEDGPSSIHMLRNLLTDQYGFAPNSISQTNSINAQLMLVRAKHGIALVPGFIVDAQGQDLVRFDLPEKRSVCYKIMYLTQHETPAVDLFFSFPDE